MRRLLIIITILSLTALGVAAQGEETLLAGKDHPWFGINLENSLEKKVEEIPNGALIKEVIVGSNAEEMGLKTGDIVKKVDEVEVMSVREFMEEIIKKKPADNVTLAVFRNGETIEISYLLEDFHKRATNAQEKLGFRVNSFEDSQSQITIITISEVIKGTYADYAGLNVNDLILALDHHDFENLFELEIILSNINLEQPVDIVVMRQKDNKPVLATYKVGPEVEEEVESKKDADETPDEEKPSIHHGD